MLCIRPYRKPSVEYGCGQCIPCRINRRRTWAARIVLESLACRESAFVTLTYGPEHLPPSGSLSKEHWREFTKGIGYRYFGVGEYGGRTFRPHYHLILFGIGAVQAEALALERWRYGFVSVRPFVAEHATYCAGYTVKKMTRAEDDRLPEGCIPEFACMSRRPGIGVPGVATWSKWYITPVGLSVVRRDLDVSSVVRINGSIYPLGRTLKRHMREAVGVPDDVPERTFARESRYRLESADPELRSRREARRVSQYERAKARARRHRGSL